MMKTLKSEALAAIHETASDLHDAGLLDKRTMREFDSLCLNPRCLTEEQAQRIVNRRTDGNKR